MKKILLSALLILGFGGYVGYYYLNNSTNAQTAPVATTAATTTTAVFPTSATTASASAPATTATAVTTNTGSSGTSASGGSTSSGITSTGQYKDGTYTGSVADAYYGNIQVKATISGGKLTNVTFLQYPNDRGQSVEINQRAMPVLKAEAIQAQSANVDGVSGASDTSAAFNQSLASALAQATA